ncbi:MAG: redoxin domain-containing protein [Phenylobacterium sp.]|uniref:redoxin domain-containing protein n=1 Tax=Phenylobacterium sp. TaxID=1871053 RepID=UPI001A4768CA|nr:redoxin domain-containing protein [Phenylobacterium sp.]MBL8771730.1 redoxin domain-containing protein [Phenylobacterium sp.]
MTKARLSMLAATASASALLVGCTTDGQAPNAFANAAPASAVAGVATPVSVDNFMLADTDYMGHELYRTDAKLVVLISHANGCPIVRNLAPAIRELKAKYEGQGVQFLMVNSAVQDSMEAIAAEKAEYGFDVPILKDANQLVGEQLGVTRTGEFFVVDPKTWKILYRGPLDDRLDYGAQKAKADHTWTTDAIEAALAGRPVVQATQQSRGCLIDFPERGKVAQISYAKQVAPILEKKCASCHTEGGIGPFAMSSYEMVKGFSPMIREVIRTDRMPPWNVDAHVGKWDDDKSLTPTEIKTLVKWVEQGAPRGDGPDVLASNAKKRKVTEWPLGKPDLVLEIPAYTIPASGVVDYQRPVVANPLTEGKWVKASSYVVGSRQGVHHFLSGYLTEVPKDGKGNESRWGASMGGYAVGAEATLWPKNVGTYLPPGGAVGFQAHYTPFGKEATDKSLLGLYFYKDGEKPELMMRNSVIVDNSIRIPAGAARHKETAYLEIPKEMLLYSAFPHAHYRGYASDLWVHLPDGTKKRLLAMPRYDFNWQREYTFAEPVKIPAGSRLVANYWYDNSKQNPANPDPTKTIVWGDQSWEEMFYTAIRYRWTEETAAKQVNYDQLVDQSRLMGMFDDNLDGKIQVAEFRGELGDRLKPFFAQMDQDKSGGVENGELQAALKMMGNMRRRQQQSAEQPAAPAPVAKPAAGGGGR